MPTDGSPSNARYVAAMEAGGTAGERVGGKARRLARLLPGPILLILILACGPGPEELRARDPRPNVVIISMDTTRADHLSAYGYERDTSPWLRALADQGMRFEVAYSPSATTGPSHASLFTGLTPIAHGVAKNGWPLEGDFETLAETLGAAGYETAAVISSYVLSDRFGFAQGFDHFDADFSQADVLSGDRVWEGETVSGKFNGRADDTTRRALACLDQRPHPERPFLLFVHYFDPHTPYRVPDGYEPPFRPGPREALKLNRTIFLYDTLIAFTDQEIGRLLTALEARGLEGDTLVIVTGDHGEGLMSHGHMFHGVHIYEEGVRVPLIVRWPGHVPAGIVAEAPATLTDLAPSVLDLANVSSAKPFQGQSIAPLLLGGDELDSERAVHLYRRRYAGGEVAEGVYAEGEKFGLRRGRWKLIEGPEEETLELFDLESDPEERENLVDREAERVKQMREEIAAWRKAHTREEKDVRLPTPEERARLEALGYTE